MQTNTFTSVHMFGIWAIHNSLMHGMEHTKETIPALKIFHFCTFSLKWRELALPGFTWSYCQEEKSTSLPGIESISACLGFTNQSASAIYSKRAKTCYITKVPVLLCGKNISHVWGHTATCFAYCISKNYVQNRVRWNATPSAHIGYLNTFPLCVYKYS